MAIVFTLGFALGFLVCGVEQAAAQSIFQLPRVQPIKDAAGKQVGTAIISGNHIVVRDASGELLGTIVIGADGKETRYDPHGNIVKR
jgi:hypothetical protein